MVRFDFYSVVLTLRGQLSPYLLTFIPSLELCLYVSHNLVLVGLP